MQREYDVCGNVTTETISAPYGLGTQNGTSVVTSYTYDNYRLMVMKTTDPSGLAYRESFTYDNYDRITKHMGSNGLVTIYNYSDPFNTMVTKTAPDNTTTFAGFMTSSAEQTTNYVGSCEFVDDNGSKKVYTYLSGPYGVFAAVVNSGGVDNVYYIYKDHLGSWTTITDSACRIVERRSFDAWGNLRDPKTWSSSLSCPPEFDRGFTGHEHLFDFNLINMNGRMYDPMMSSFLSPDNYIQDPTTQQGFNRYAYCRYNPLKYVDPSGERYFGWRGDSSYFDESAARLVMSFRFHVYLVSMRGTWERIDDFSNSLWSEGHKVGTGNGCHGVGKELELDSKIKEFQEMFFPNAPMEYVKKFVVEGLDKEYYFYNDDKLGGRTSPLSNNGILTGNSNVYFNDGYVFESPENLYYTMGHEFVHVSQVAELKGVERDILRDPDFIMTIEYHANAWALSAGSGINKIYDRFEIEMITCYSARYHLDFSYFKWTSGLIHPSNWFHP